jgi:methylated-DNA-[protein]-cysteine S-methyltransferase
MPVFYFNLMCPWGPLLLIADGQYLTGLYFSDEGHCPTLGPDWIEDRSVLPLTPAIEQLTRYFEGGLREFSLPLKTQGTEFQKSVWQALPGIHYGQTISYTQLAYQVGRPHSVRAVGQANSRNPISIILPCHRVIGSNGSLTGYGGGLNRKRALLDFEASHHPT